MKKIETRAMISSFWKSCCFCPLVLVHIQHPIRGIFGGGGWRDEGLNVFLVVGRKKKKKKKKKMKKVKKGEGKWKLYVLYCTYFTYFPTCVTETLH